MAERFDLLKAQRQVWDSGLRAPEKLTMLALLDHWSMASQTPFPSTARLARMTTQSKRTVIRTIADLERLGVLVVTRRVGQSNAYTLRPELAPKVTPDQCQSGTGARESPVPESHPTSARVTPPPVSESHPKEPIEGTHEGTHIGATHEPPPSKKPPKPKPQKPPKAKAKKWTFVPDDWQPTDAHRAKARELGVSLEEQVELFRAHEFRVPKTDADRAFHGWLTRAASWAPAPRGGGSGAPRVQMSIKEGWQPTVLEFGDEPEVSP